MLDKLVDQGRVISYEDCTTYDAVRLIVYMDKVVNELNEEQVVDDLKLK